MSKEKEFGGELSGKELEKVTGGEGTIDRGFNTLYCRKVADSQTFEYLFKNGLGCPDYFGIGSPEVKRCSSCEHLEIRR